MLILIGPILFIVLILFAIRLQKQGLAGWKAALLVVLGSPFDRGNHVRIALRRLRGV